MELANFEIWEKWFMLLGSFAVAIILVFWPTDKEDDFIDVPDFIKGKDSDFYGN